MSRLNTAPARTRVRPASIAFPTQARSSSMNGSASTSLLSPRSSMRSGKSSQRLAVNQDPPMTLAPERSGLTSASTSSLPILDGGDHPTLVAQLEWAARDSDSPLASPASVPAFMDSDAISVLSVRSHERPSTPSVHSLPPTSPLSASFSRRSPSPNPPLYGSASTSPLRLVPRSPLKDRIPFAERDLDFLRNAPKPKSDDGQSSIRSSSTTNESVRAQRLREDIERTAARLRSTESMRSAGAEDQSALASANPGIEGLAPGAVHATQNAPQRSRTSTSESTTSAGGAGEDTASLGSTASSGFSSAPSAQNSIKPLAWSQRASPMRPQRPPELKEWSQSCWVWQSMDLTARMPTSASSSSLSMSLGSGAGKLAKLDVSLLCRCVTDPRGLIKGPTSRFQAR